MRGHYLNIPLIWKAPLPSCCTPSAPSLALEVGEPFSQVGWD